MKAMKIFFLSILMIAATQGFAQKVDYLNPSKHTIARTDVIGVDHLNHDAIVLISGLTPGKEITVPGDDITQAIKKLWQQDLFNDVEVGYTKIDPVTDDIFMYIKLIDRPKISSAGGYKFTGDVSKGDADKLRDATDLYAGKTITEALKRNTINTVRGFYQEKGFFKCNVTCEESIDTNEFNARVLNFIVAKGERIKIAEINFINNEIPDNPELGKIKNMTSKLAVSDGGLRRTMKDTKRQGIMRIFSRSKFNKAAYERDKQAIIYKYNEIGLRDAYIIKDSVYYIDESHMAIDMYIDKGS
ncbi:MAG: outer membrane protein insertion porin family, partial [Arenicella sp.]